MGSGLIPAPPDFQKMLADLERRVQVLENSPPAYLQPIGFQAGASGQSIASTSPVDISGSSFTTSQIVRTVPILYLVFCTAHLSAGSGTGRVWGDIVGFDVTADMLFKNTGADISLDNAFIWYWAGFGVGNQPNGIPAGSYTVKMQADADSGTTIVIDQFFHQVWTLPA